MPLDADHNWEPEKVLPNEELRAIIHLSGHRAVLRGLQSNPPDV
jgi:hypothetical protein